MKSVLCDTCFLIDLLDETKPFHTNCKEYAEYFIRQQIDMRISTISIAEYCVRGDYDDLLKYEFILPISYHENMAIITSAFARILLDAKRNGINEFPEINKKIIANDVRLLATANSNIDISYYISSDIGNQAIYDFLKEKTEIKFQFINFSNVNCDRFFNGTNLFNDPHNPNT